MRRIATAVGTLSTAAGCALLLTPLSAPFEPPVVPTLGVVALLALAVGSLGAVDRSRTAPDVASLPDPGGRADVDAPGDEFDRALAGASPRAGSEDRVAIRERLETLALARLRTTEGCSRDAARRRLREGDWTDDGAAAAFFAESGAGSRPLREHVRHLLTGESAFERRASRAIDALYDRESGRDDQPARSGHQRAQSDHRPARTDHRPARSDRERER